MLVCVWGDVNLCVGAVAGVGVDVGLCMCVYLYVGKWVCKLHH